MSAPGAPESVGGLPECPPCPFCEGVETELVNAFGSHASVSSYWCRRCRSPFEVLKWRGTGGEPAGREAPPTGDGSPRDPWHTEDGGDP